jgi:hypothetical protein
MDFALAPALLALFALAAQDERADASSQDEGRQEDKAETIWEYIVLKYDADGDQRVSQAEYRRGEVHWTRLDKNEDGFLEQEEFTSTGRRGGRHGSGERGGPRGEGDARPTAPEAGEVAPDFELVVLPAQEKSEDGEKQSKVKSKAAFVKLSSLKGKQPVALIFGSYT